MTGNNCAIDDFFSAKDIMLYRFLAENSQKIQLKRLSRVQNHVRVLAPTTQAPPSVAQPTAAGSAPPPHADDPAPPLQAASLTAHRGGSQR